jgi:hypothetical protein
MSRRALLPREHGAYFQLAIPLAAALAMRPPRMAAIAWALAACLAFLAHEPLLVLLGHRGRRMRSAEAGRARRALAVRGGGAIALGAAALVLGSPALRVAAAACLAPAAVVVALAWRRREHSLFGELIAAVALTGAAVPVVADGGGGPSVALAIWLGWATGFAAGVIAVHRVIARHKRGGARIDVVLAIGLVALAALSVATVAWFSGSRPAAPLVSLAAGVVIAPPPASRLRAVGVAIALAAAIAGVLSATMG